MLRRYASRRIALAALSEWLVQVDYDDGVSRAERVLVARIRLTAIDAAEGLCSEDAVVKDISSLLDAATGSLGRRQPA